MCNAPGWPGGCNISPVEGLFMCGMRDCFLFLVDSKGVMYNLSVENL